MPRDARALTRAARQRAREKNISYQQAREDVQAIHQLMDEQDLTWEEAEAVYDDPANSRHRPRVSGPGHPRHQEWLDRRLAAAAHLHRLITLAHRNMPLDQPENPWYDVQETLSAICTNINLDCANIAAGRDVRDLPRGWIEVDLSATDYYQAILHGAAGAEED